VGRTRFGETGRPHFIRMRLAEGLRNKEIAARLQISEETAQSHVRSILLELGLHAHTEAVAVAVRRGIVHPD